MRTVPGSTGHVVVVGAGMAGQLGLDRGRTAHQLNGHVLGHGGERLHRSRHFGLRSSVAPHRVHRDANHAQASSTSTCFLPR